MEVLLRREVAASITCLREKRARRTTFLLKRKRSVAT